MQMTRHDNKIVVAILAQYFNLFLKTIIFNEFEDYISNIFYDSLIR